MSLSGELTYAEWEALGTKLTSHVSASAWWIGDWVLFGRAKYRRRYKAALEATGLDYQTLRNYASVARSFEPGRRRERLTFQHHAELCALSHEEQDHWLDRAELNHWTRNCLRQEVRRARSELAVDGALVAHAETETLAITVTSKTASVWRSRAASAEQPLAAWLEQAVGAGLRALEAPPDTPLTPRVPTPRSPGHLTLGGAAQASRGVVASAQATRETGQR